MKKHKRNIISGDFDIVHYLAEKGMNANHIALACGLSKSTISSLLRASSFEDYVQKRNATLEKSRLKRAKTQQEISDQRNDVFTEETVPSFQSSPPKRRGRLPSFSYCLSWVNENGTEKKFFLTVEANNVDEAEEKMRRIYTYELSSLIPAEDIVAQLCSVNWFDYEGGK